MKHLLLLVCLFPFALFAQKHTAKTVEKNVTGVHFEHNLSWSDIQRKARAENKYIFMDCYTTWCGPCKYMSKNIFPQEAVGNAMNGDFICVKMQLDTSEADNAEVKKMYALAHAMARNYKVNVYPTFLFFNPNGELVHRAVGSSEADQFIAKTQEALHPETQYYSLLAKYNKGKKDSGFLHRLTEASMSAYDMENANRIAGDYLATQPNLYTTENLTLLKNITQKSSDPGFQLMLQNADKADSVLGKGTADAIVQNIIMQEEVYPKLFPPDVTSVKDLQEPNWREIDNALSEKYPTKAASLSAYSKVVFYIQTKDWEKFGPAVVTYMKSYGDDVSEDQLNSFAWAVFQNCNDETCLQNALDWSKRSFEEDQNPAFMDTYANILYRLGKKEEAMSWEQKAADLVTQEEKAGYLQTIDKMKAGEKTWNEAQH